MGRLSGIPAMGTGQTGAVRVAIGVPVAGITAFGSELKVLKQVQDDSFWGGLPFLLKPAKSSCIGFDRLNQRKVTCCLSLSKATAE